MLSIFDEWFLVRSKILSHRILFNTKSWKTRPQDIRRAFDLNSGSFTCISRLANAKLNSSVAINLRLVNELFTFILLHEIVLWFYVINHFNAKKSLLTANCTLSREKNTEMLNELANTIKSRFSKAASFHFSSFLTIDTVFNAVCVSICPMSLKYINIDVCTE